MPLTTRVTRLESRRPAGRCPTCRRRPGTVLRVRTAPDRPEREPDDDASPCPRCGWQPTVVEVEEALVTR